MKPLELSSVTEVWRSSLVHLQEALSDIGTDIQLWFPWGQNWRGHDGHGVLPPTPLPADLVSSPLTRFGGRLWRPVKGTDDSWLLSVKGDGEAPTARFRDLALPARAMAALRLLEEFVRLEGLLGLMMKVLEQQAGEHVGHWDRVRQMSTAIGRRLGFSGRDLVELELAGLLHDIGKVGLPPAVLAEARPLSPAERRLMESHSLVGAAMIREIPGMERVAAWVLGHHETPDGSGYPKGLTAAEIPLGAMIVAAADSFDSMTHFRPYATERTYKESIQEMIRHQGRYDDRVLWALQEVLREVGIFDARPMVNVDGPNGPPPMTD
jgi:HD-GYP domain-containing protein (c-di-GMP phosphodiesterase class II)